MKWIKYLSFLLVLAIYSCSNTTEEPDDELLNGKIDGIDFEVKTATYKINSDGKLEFDINSESSSGLDPCLMIPLGPSMFFVSDDNTDRQDLYLDLNNFEGFTINFLNPDNGSNLMVSEGYFEILSHENETINAKMDINANDENFAKGEFTATKCP